MLDPVERESALAALREGLRAATTRGQIAPVSGEAGIGKTSVLRALAESHEPVWWGACDALQTPHPLAPLLDIAREAGARFAGKFDGPRPALLEAVLDELRLAAAPVLMVIEDAHWADDATLDLLKYLGRRIERTRALLAVSFRDDEVTATHPLRRVLGEMPPAAVAGIYEVTHGNPFFVTEVLRDAGSPVPRSVQDVVLARAARLPPPAQDLLQLVSVVPGRTEGWLVVATAAGARQRFVIERQMPGASKMTAEQLRDAAEKSNGVLRELGPDIQWVHSYAAGDKIYCVYNAPNEVLIRSHAERSGFPANRITPVAAVIDPTTAQQPR